MLQRTMPQPLQWWELFCEGLLAEVFIAFEKFLCFAPFCCPINQPKHSLQGTPSENSESLVVRCLSEWIIGLSYFIFYCVWFKLIWLFTKPLRWTACVTTMHTKVVFAQDGSQMQDERIFLFVPNLSYTWGLMSNKAENKLNKSLIHEPPRSKLT